MVEYANSSDGERYDGLFDTINEAVYESGIDDGEIIYVGECASPTQPEDWWEAADWLEHVSCQDEYGGEWAEGWDESTKEQRAELTDAVRKVMAEWLDRHKLRPTFFNIKNEAKYTVENGVVVKIWP